MENESKQISNNLDQLAIDLAEIQLEQKDRPLAKSQTGQPNQKDICTEHDVDEEAIESKAADITFHQVVKQLLGGDEKNEAGQRLKRITTKVDWLNNSENGKLSYDKMVDHRNNVHFRIKQEQAKKGEVVKYKRYPCCVKTGWFSCQDSSDQVKEIDDNFGLGIAIYFKQLKSLIILFTILTIISIPSMINFYYGVSSTMLDSKSFFTLFSLGNLGQATHQCSQASRNQTQQMFCAYGVAKSLDLVALVDPVNNQCSADSTNSFKSITSLDQNCNVTSSPQVQSYFNKTCLGQKQCNVTVSWDWFPISCRNSSYKAIFMTYCEQNDISIPGFKQTLPRYKLTYIVIALDLAVTVTFVIFIYSVKHLIQKEAKEFDQNTHQITDFTIMVKNLPDESRFKTLYQLKAMLTVHFDGLIMKQPQIFDEIKNQIEAQKFSPAEIAEINFGQRNFETYHILRQIHKLADQGRQVEEKIRNTDNEKKKENLLKQKEKCKDKVEKLKIQYLEHQQKKLDVKTAYIVFRSMEGKARALNAYSKLGCCKKFCQKCPCQDSDLFELAIADSYPTVSEAIDPSLILWENLGYSATSRCFRKSIFSIIAFVLVILCVLINLYATETDKAVQLFSPQVQCDSNVIIQPEAAFADKQKNITDQQGLMYCFCKQEYKANSTANYKFSDGKYYCYDWLSIYLLSNSLVYIVPIIIGILNYLSKVILQKMTECEKRQSVPELKYSTSVNIMVISFINAGILVLLVNLSIGVKLPLPILQGKYGEFSVEWYRLVGSSLVVQMVIMIFSVNLTALVFQMISCCCQCKDRGCKCSGSKITQKLTQEDYENINTGSDPNIEYRYATMMTMIYVVMFYGSGIPILYLVAAIYFFVTYWTDKFLILNYYRKPEYLDHRLAIQILGWMKVAVLLHLAGGILMYSNSNILPVQVKDFQNSAAATLGNYTKGYSFGSINSIQMAVYMGVIVGIVALYLVYRIFYKTICSLKEKCKSVEEDFKNQNENHPVPCIYEKLETRELKVLRSQSLKDKNEVDEIAKNPPELSAEIKACYLKLQQEKINNLDQVIRDRARNKFEMSEEEVSKKEIDDLFNEMLLNLETQEKANKGLESLSGDLHSYNILENLKYDELSDYKKILDKQIKDPKVKQ